LLTNCALPPALDEKQLLAHIDGEAGRQVADHLAKCPYCRDRANELRRLQENLTARLYRLACPSSQELGDYHLGLLPVGRAAAVAGHLRECIHCTREISQLKDYLIEFAPTAPGPLEGFKVLIAKLIGEKGERRQPGEFALAPAFAMLRGDAQGPVLLEADGILITLDIQPAAEGRATILGQVAAQEQDAWTGARVELRQGGELQGTATVDDLGAFRFESISSGSGELQIHPARGPVVQANIHVEA
jgi:hypothetical protein